MPAAISFPSLWPSSGDFISRAGSNIVPAEPGEQVERVKQVERVERVEQVEMKTPLNPPPPPANLCTCFLVDL